MPANPPGSAVIFAYTAFTLWGMAVGFILGALIF